MRSEIKSIKELKFTQVNSIQMRQRETSTEQWAAKYHKFVFENKYLYSDWLVNHSDFSFGKTKLKARFSMIHKLSMEEYNTNSKKYTNCRDDKPNTQRV